MNAAAIIGIVAAGIAFLSLTITVVKLVFGIGKNMGVMNQKLDALVGLPARVSATEQEIATLKRADIDHERQLKEIRTAVLAPSDRAH